MSKNFSREKARGQTGTFLVLFLTVMIGYFFTVDQYYRYMENTTALVQARAEGGKKESSLQALNATEKKLSTDKNLRSDIDRYAGVYREDAIMNSIFAPKANISISEISMDKGDRLPNGLSLASISLSVRAGDLLSLTNYLDYLTSGSYNTRSYVIKSVSFPYDSTTDGAQNVSLELGMYYFGQSK